MYKVEKIRKKINIKGPVREREPLNTHTTFQTGGPADIYMEPEDPEELIRIIIGLNELEIPWFILGGGANILVSDKGVRGAVISTKRLSRIGLTGDILTMEAGLDISQGALKAGRWGLGGLEFIYGMPGSVGGALWMNARCYGGEISRNLLWTEILNEQNERERVPFRESDWDYKVSPFQNRECVILSAAFRMHREKTQVLIPRMDEIKNDRERKGHYRAPCGGSTFKNNRSFGSPSGILIEQAGLKGTKIGGAAVSSWHGNIVINENHASSAEIARLIELVQQRVQEETGYLLEPEVLKVGEWSDC